MKNNLLYYLDKSREFLEKKGIPSARLDAEVILADILGLERIKLYSKFDMPLSPGEQDLYRKKIIERATFKPVAYITGKKYFYHDEFIVNESVLIPRPETEELIEWVLTVNDNSPRQVLDLCTGSGCIGITLKRERPAWNMVLSDISTGALAVARKNAEVILHTSDIEFLESDLFAGMDQRQFDLIVSNPPYIPRKEKQELMPDVLFEPELALFIDDENSFFSRFLLEAKKFLKPGGSLYMEIHQNSAPLHMRIGTDTGFKVETRKDLSGKERMVRFVL